MPKTVISAPISILIADQQYLTAVGLKTIFDGESNFTVKHVLHDLSTLKDYLITFQPDVLMIDYQSVREPYQLDLMSSLFDSNITSKILAISDDQDQVKIRKIIGLGVKGFITKNSNRSEIIDSAKAVYEGQRYFCNSVLDILVEPNIKENEPKSPEKLTTREHEILILIANGHTTMAIADRLNISVHTVNSHRKNILKKLNVKSPTQLVVYALDTGLVKIPQTKSL